MTREDLINQRATTCRHGGHCEWVACDKCNHYEPDSLNQQPCDDCISRQTVLEDINAETEGVGFYYEHYVKYIKALPTVTPKEKTGWIPVSERLPEDYGEYICTMSNDNVQECGFIPSGEKGLIPGWSTCEADGFKKLDYRDIKAWMPLPEPYEPQKSEDKE